MNLFESEPLSYRMVPQTLDEYEGQPHLIGEHRPINTMIKNKIVQSMIFYGAPASGKTGLARLIAKCIEAEYFSLNALTLSSEDIRDIHHKATLNRERHQKTVLFIDEIHRLTKPKQDAFLSSLESGLIILIGATTENPYFSLNPALRSRVLIFEFFTLNQTEKKRILERALTKDPLIIQLQISMTDEAKDFLIAHSSDPRHMLNILETATFSLPVGSTLLTNQHLQSVMQKTDTHYDSKDMHYDVISAFIKSIRGSDPDASLYYLAWMIHSGEDSRFIFRRLMISAVEDVGMAFPEAINVVVACANAFEIVGLPEGILHLSHATLYLANLPKSNTVLSIYDALNDIKNGNLMSVPDYLRDQAHFSQDKKNASKYLYPHDYPSHFIKQSYTSKPISYYHPSEQGFEKKISERWKRLWKK
ncbi:MAG: replication-associated recombination protein A [Brevinema sp.]